jgi:hypothetical protein
MSIFMLNKSIRGAEVSKTKLFIHKMLFNYNLIRYKSCLDVNRGEKYFDRVDYHEKQIQLLSNKLLKTL